MSLGSTSIDNDGLAGIKDWKHLKKLKLPPAATDEGFIHLAGLESLEELDLKYSRKITGAGLRHLKDLANFRFLDLDSSSVTDEGLEGVKHLRQLTGLELHRTKITAAGLVHLEGLTNLRNIWLPKHESITEDVMHKLRKKLPKTSIGKSNFS